MTTIAIPDFVTEIGYQAFASCTSLEKLTLSDALTHIGYEAFLSCASLQNITIPASVTDIEYRAFANCTSLTQAVLPTCFRKSNTLNSIFGDYTRESSSVKITYRDTYAKKENADCSIKLNTDTFELIGKTYREIADTYGMPNPGYDEGACVYFDNKSFCCGFQNYIDASFPPDSDDICTVVSCPVDYLIQGLDNDEYTFEELQTLFSSAGFTFSYGGFGEGYCEYYYILYIPEYAQYPITIYTPTQNNFQIQNLYWIFIK